MQSGTKMFTVDKFLGINEAADGYTELKMGEASKMVNWFITDAFNLTVRPGIQRVDFQQERETAQILASWSGFVGDIEYLVIVDFLDGSDRIWMYRQNESGVRYAYYHQSGALGLSGAENAKVKIFTFSGKLYIMSAGNTVIYKDGSFQTAKPYVPLVITGASPSGGGASLESLNLLTAMRRIDFSADGTSKAYVLPAEATGVAAITIDNTEANVSSAGTFNAGSHTFTFTNAPEKGVGNVEITYKTDAVEAENNRMKIVNMPLVEAYNGSTDTRLFVAGDGSNICYYTGVPQSGQSDALYFPGMNEVAVDMSGSPVTGMVRHYGKLLVFKPDGTFTITYEPVTLADGNVVAGFYLRSASREFGNDVTGQVQTVNNYPRTFSKGGIYEWRITSSYYQDERYAIRVSDKVEKSLQKADYDQIVTCDDNFSKSYYVFLNDEDGTVLVNRYALEKDGIWCVYQSNLCKNVRNAVMHGGKMVFVTDNDVFYFSESNSQDAPEISGGDSQTIDALWESGYMAFGADFRRKYSSQIYVSMLPSSYSEMVVTASTDKREEYMEKSLSSNVFGFGNLNFSHWTFDTRNTPRIQRVRLKVKKFVYYKLIFRVEAAGARATVLGFDQQVRFSSMAK